MEEKNAFTSSVVAVPTAVPAFIGYTEKALRGKNSLLNKPTRITSLMEYVDLFGEGPHTTYSIKDVKDGEGRVTDFKLTVDANTRYLLYDSIRLFFANGGGACYIVSVGDYSKGVSAKDLNDPKTGGGLPSLLKEQEPTMVVVPDAVLLDEGDCYSLYQAILQHCGADTMSRVGIFDVYNGYKPRIDENGKDIIDAFRNGVGVNFLAFASGYYPWVNSTVVGADEIDYTRISNSAKLIEILDNEAQVNYLGSATARSSASASKNTGGGASTTGDKSKTPPPPPAPTDDKAQQKYAAAKAEIDKIGNAEASTSAVHQTLLAISPMYKDILAGVRAQLNILPPSAAMAGIYSLVDNTVGVHKAPANVSLTSVVSPAVPLTSEEQEDLNMPLNGKAVNAIRSFIGKGVLVWGARTLDGNSQDWRYVSVRRTVIMLEQSIKASVEAHVFEPNTAQTWLRVRSSIENFLTDMWQAGTLVGSSTAEAFEVQVGLGTTMTPVDILDGVMKITVKAAISRPAEFIVITFQQKMQES
ncbi:MAG: hypothetical protein OHK0039_16180 [Bacteroidia bacterium]